MDVGTHEVWEERDGGPKALRPLEDMKGNTFGVWSDREKCRKNSHIMRHGQLHAALCSWESVGPREMCAYHVCLQKKRTNELPSSAAVFAFHQKSARPVLFLSGALFVRGSAKKRKRSPSGLPKECPRGQFRNASFHSVLVLVASMLAIG